MKFDIFSELGAARIEEIKAASKYAQLPKGSTCFIRATYARACYISCKAASRS